MSGGARRADLIGTLRRPDSCKFAERSLKRSCEFRTLQLVARGNVDGRPSSHFDTVDRKIEKRVLGVDR